MENKKAQVQSLIVRDIVSGSYGPGDRIPSEREMMKRSNTSRITVRSAYTELQERGILRIQHGSGAYVADQWHGNTGRVRSIAVLATLSDVFGLEFIDALERAVDEQGAFLILRQTDQDASKEREAAIELAELGVQNLVVWASGRDYDEELFRRLRVLGTNMVFFDRMRPTDFADYVGTDNYQGVKSLMDDAVSRGKRRFVFVGYQGQEWTSFIERERAFERRCDELALPGKIVKVPWSDEAAHFLHGHSRDVMRILLSERALDVLREHRGDWFHDVNELALICVNDYVALQVREIVPRDTPVYGFDGIPEATEHGVVTYRHPMETMAHAAVQRLFVQAERGKRWRAETQLFPGSLIRP